MVAVFIVIAFSTSGICAQNVRVNIKTTGKTYEAIVPDIIRQTGTEFLYDKEILESPVGKDRIESEGTLEDVLEDIFEGTKISFKVSGNKVFLYYRFGSPVDTPRQIASGRIVDENGYPLAGATVIVTGYTIGTSSDMEGKFTLADVPSDAKTLTISYLDKLAVLVPIKKSMLICLEPANHAINSIVVVAYGEQKRSAFTGAAGQLDTKEISNRQITNAFDAIGGRIAGVQMIRPSGSPSASPEFRIRGIGSINAGKDPLIIVDGMPYEGGLNNLNPRDVESITVHKDATSNALYGARGANGVIMVTTKEASRSETRISFDARVGVNHHLDNSYDFVSDPRQYYEMHYSALKNYFRTNLNYSHLSDWETHMMANETLYISQQTGGLGGYITYTTPENELLVGPDGKFNTNATLGRIVEFDGNKYLIKPDNYSDDIFRKGIRQEYNLGIDGGSDRMQIYASLGYLKNKGIVYGSDYERISGRLNVRHQARHWLELGANIAFTHSIGNNSDSSIFTFLSEMAPIYPLYIRDADGYIMTDENGIMYDYGNSNEAPGLERPLKNASNPLKDTRLETNNSNSNTFSGHAFADINLTSKLKLSVNLSIVNREYRSTSTTQPYYGHSYDGGSVDKSHTRVYAFNSQQLLNYGTRIGNHSISAMAGHDWYNRSTYYLSGKRSNLISYNDNQELDGALQIVSNGSSVRADQIEGYFARGTYDYDHKYFINVSFRRDASIHFQDNNKWGNFWTAGAAWLLSREHWFNTPWVSSLKLKASYGSQGNDDIGDFRYTDTYSIAPGDVGAIIFNNKGNPDITWETNKSTNVGFEANFFSGRLTAEFDMFYRKTSDMLMRISPPSSAGYGSYYANAGNMVNKGLELTLSGDIIHSGDFVWNAGINITHYRNRITHIPGNRKSSELDGHAGFYSGSYFYGEGLPMYTWKMPKFAGLDDSGQATYYVTDSETSGMSRTTDYSSATDYNCGNAIPLFYGGFSMDFRYRQFDLSMSLSYSVGGKAYDDGYRRAMRIPSFGSTGFSFHKDLLNAWSEDNFGSDIPRWVFNDGYATSTSDRFLKDASWLNVQSIALGYTFTDKVVDSMKLSRLRIYVSCDNAAFFSARKGFDPSRSWDGSTSTEYYPYIRVFTFGVTVQF